MPSFKFSLVVLCSPHQGTGSRSALEFAKAIHAAGHELYRVFFYSDGALNAHRDSPLSDEWTQLHLLTHTDLVACTTSASSRGVANKTEARQQGLDSPTMNDSFESSGLGQLLDASIHSDRMVTFAQ